MLHRRRSWSRTTREKGNWHEGAGTHWTKDSDFECCNKPDGKPVEIDIDAELITTKKGMELASLTISGDEVELNNNGQIKPNPEQPVGVMKPYHPGDLEFMHTVNKFGQGWNYIAGLTIKEKPKPKRPKVDEDQNYVPGQSDCSGVLGWGHRTQSERREYESAAIPVGPRSLTAADFLLVHMHFILEKRWSLKQVALTVQINAIDSESVGTTTTAFFSFQGTWWTLSRVTLCFTSVSRPY